jgi:hypothetical protein
MTTPEQQPDRDDGHDGVYPGPKCGGNKRQGEGKCTQAAGWGTTHPGIGACKLHGGATESHTVAAAVTQAKRDVVLFGARRDVHPAEALLELVQWTAGEVDYWRSRVRVLDEEALTWGVTKVKEEGHDKGTTYEAKPNIAYSMLVDASNRLERYAASALKAGVDERRVRVAESQGTQLLGVLISCLTELGHDVSPGSEAAQIVLRHVAPLQAAARAEIVEGEAS